VKMADRTQLERMDEILTAATQLKADLRRTQIVSGLQARAARGQWMWRAPLGYLRASVGGTKTLLPDPERARHIRLAFDLYASGSCDRFQVLETVRKAGLRTVQGKSLSLRTLSTLLANPVYLGRLVVPRWNIDILGNWQPLVSEETFDRVQRLLSEG
jgi:site-specific DNA recombinase